MFIFGALLTFHEKTVILFITSLALAGCADKPSQVKGAMDSVISVHDKVMGEDEQLLKNKGLLDSLAKQDTSAIIKDSVSRYLSEVTNADRSMDNWMHNFDPDLTGKLPEEKMVYLHAQKKLIVKIDSQINAAISKSDNYLKKMKKK